MSAESPFTETPSNNLAVVSRAEARQRGLKRYFTGKPCKNGHVCERITSCKKCLLCHAERMRRWHHANLDEAHRRQCEYRLANPDKVIAAHRRAYMNDRANRIKQNTKWQRKNRKRHNEFVRNYAKNYPHARAAHRQNRRARLRAAEGTHSAGDLRAIFQAQKGLCAICLADLSKVPRHVDHIVPLASGGTNWPTNLQYLCAPCNLSKATKDADSFRKERAACPPSE